MTKIKKPFVAIITPLYNDATRILKAIESVKNQTFINHVHYICDDHSTDNSADIVREYMKWNPTEPIVFTATPSNQGQSNTRNKILQLAAIDGAEYIAFLDSDDYWEHEHLETGITALQTENVDMIYSVPNFINEDGDFLTPYGIPIDQKPTFNNLYKNNFIFISSVILRKSCYDIIGEFDGELNSIEDWDYWTRIAKENLKIHKIPTTNVSYLVRSNSMASTVTINQLNKFKIKHIMPEQQLIKLNLGCGDEILDGYINCDIDHPRADMLFDAAKIPFPDNSVDEIRAYHIIEHFPFQKGLEVLKEWFRVLKPNGRLVFETPDLLNTCKTFVDATETERIILYGHFFACPDLSPWQTHYFLFTETQMTWSLEQTGFTDIQRLKPDSIYAKSCPQWESVYLKMEAYKPMEISKPKVYDGFLFFNELDMLDIRLNELNDTVDTFVLVESDTTFTGIPKPFYYEENKERFKQFADKITHIKITGTPHTDSPWDAEKYQRDKIYDGMQQCAPDDIVIISDVDEIPNKEAIRNFDPTKGVTILQQKTSYYYLNCVSNLLWWNTKIGTWKDMQKESAYDVRANNNNRFVVGEGGWHFTGLGGIESILTKLDAFSHKEYNTEYFRDKELLKIRIKNGWDVYERPTIVATYWDIDDDFPEYIVKNQKLLTEMGYIRTFDPPQSSIDPAVYTRFQELNYSLYDEIFVQGDYMATEEDIKGKVYVDIGANVGMTAIKAISLGAKKVLAFEPEISNLNIILDVTRNLENVFVYHKAVYNSQNYIQVTNEGMLSNMFQVKESDERVHALSLGEVTRLIQSNEHAVMKIDCEGGEYDILYNTEPENIQRFDMLYLEIHNDLVPQYINGEADLINYLTRLGFECEKLPFASGVWYPDGSFEETNNVFYKCKNKQIKIN